MAQPDKSTFLNKLARFVTNPTTDWTALNSLPSDLPSASAGEATVSLSQAEIVALRHQRRKRNRTTRIQEFSILRQLRAGASIGGMQTVLSTGNSNLKMQTALLAPTTRPTQIADFNVNQIDRIEQQMTEQWWDKKETPAVDFTPASMADELPKTQMLIETEIMQHAASPALENDVIAFDPTLFDSPSPETPQTPSAKLNQGENPTINGSGEQVDFSEKQSQDASTFVYRAPRAELQNDSPDTSRIAVEDLHSTEFQIPLSEDEVRTMADVQAMQAQLQAKPLALHEISVPITYKVEDLPEGLNEPAILFVQGKNTEVEERLLELAKAEWTRATQQRENTEPHILLSLLDFYRCTNQEEKFETASIQMVQHFDRSAPQYQGGDLGEATRILSTLGAFSPSEHAIQGNWRCPAVLDLTDVMLLRAQLMAQPAQVLLDWQLLQTILDDAIEPLLDQFRDLAGRKIDLLMWGGNHLLECCTQKLESLADNQTAVSALLWHLRLELVGIMHGQEAFDQLALEYCVAREESPPSWKRKRCRFIDADDALSLLDRSAHPETGSIETPPKDMEATLQHPLQWRGDLKGNIQAILKAVDTESSQTLVIDCSQLNIMDYSATAALLKWLMEPQNAQRQIQFIQVNRLLGVFWRIMGVTVKASVELRRD